MNIAIAVVIGLAVSLIVTRIVELAARRRRLLDIPNDRSSHDEPTPRLGGLGIIAGTLATLVVSGTIADLRILVVLLGATFVAAVGLLDDVRHISVKAKLAGQIAPAIGAVILLDPLVAIDVPGATVMTLPQWASWLVGVASVVVICNVVNFMDGTDGLVASYVSIAGVALGLFLGASPLFIALAAGCLGFLVWNRAPASIFMGDTGSQFIGFMLGAGLLVQEATASLLMGLLVLAPLLFDTTLTMTRRIVGGRSIVQAHREHLYQRIAVRWGHGIVSIVYAAAAVLCALAAYAYADLGFELLPFAIVAPTLTAIFIVSVRSGVPDASTVARGHHDT